MNLKKIVLLITLFIPYLSNAQTSGALFTDGAKCSISSEAAAAIKQRLMDNRNSFTREEVEDLVTNRVITYIPLSIHNVAGDNNGLGKTSEQAILGFLCGLNEIYADQDVQFFIRNTIYNRVSTFIYNNAGSSTSRSQMMSYRIGNTLNLIIGASAQNQVASWYDIQGDFIFLLKSMLSAEAKTEAHEIGHFFTLPHTFSGWEGLDVEATYGGGSVPFSVGSGWSQFSPERAARTGSQANCNQAADGFCDTEADYYSDRKNCPYSPNVTDPYGNAIDPDESNLMSYASDACVTQFSAQQKAAIAMDIASRNWITNTPNSLVDITTTPSVVSPAHNAQLGDISNPTVRLEWTTVPGATWYYIEVLGTMLPGFWLPNTNDIKYRGIVYNNTGYFDLPTTDLVAGNRYTWRVKAINGLRTCAPISSYSNFEAVANVTTAIKDLPIEKQMTFSINSNPITTSFIPLSIYAAEDVIGSIRIFAMDGREVLAMTKEAISAGESLIQFPAENLSNGMYVAVLLTDRGQLQQKIVIQR